jgi:hypothetical protein
MNRDLSYLLDIYQYGQITQASIPELLPHIQLLLPTED